MKQDVFDNATAATMPRPGSQAQPGTPSNGDMQEMMKKAEAASMPGPEHAALEHFVGTWKAEVKCWMDPNSPPNQSQGTAEARWILGGRFLEESFHGSFMGKPFHGRAILGFNKVKQTYQSVWIDDMSTSMFVSEGQGDGKVITLEGRASCPATGRTDISMRVVYRVLGPNQHIFEMLDGSKDFAKTMEISYTRQ
jgi:hypothetical protein